MAVLHDDVSHSRCVYSPDVNDDASAPLTVCSPTPKFRPETITEYPPDIAKFGCSVNDDAGASKLKIGLPVPEMRATIDAIVDIFKQCFGTEVAELEKKTDFSKLAQAKMTEDNIGWKRMLNNRGRLKKWVDNVIQTKELWSVIPSFEDEQLESQLEEELEGDATSSDGSDCGSSSDDDEPLAATKNRHQQRHLKFWMESMKPLPKETEDEYAERVTLLVERGSSTRANRRKRAQGDPAPPVVDDLVAAGTEARLY